VVSRGHEKGTGSNTIVAKDVFVPEHRIYSGPKTFSGERLALRLIGEPSDSYAFVAANCLIGLAVVMGIAQGMLSEVIKGTTTRGVSFTDYARQADSSVFSIDRRSITKDR
jgi:3-hydroxy-9,10-secoandrosta-1,3,5(10)-triene-9,17-dione monooxygenase